MSRLVNLDTNREYAQIEESIFDFGLSLHTEEDIKNSDALITVVEYMDKPMKDIILIFNKSVDGSKLEYLKSLCAMTHIYYSEFDDVFLKYDEYAYVFRFLRPFDKAYYLFQAQIINFISKNEKHLKLKYHISFGEVAV